MIIKKITSKQDGLKLEIAIMEVQKIQKESYSFHMGWRSIKSSYFDFMQY